VDSEELRQQIRQVLNETDSSDAPEQYDSSRKLQILRILVDADCSPDESSESPSCAEVIWLPSRSVPSSLIAASRLEDTRQPESQPPAAFFLIPSALFLALFYSGLIPLDPLTIPMVSMCFGLAIFGFVLAIQTRSQKLNTILRALGSVAFSGYGIYLPAIELANYLRVLSS